MNRRDTGILGEKLARGFLHERGYRILETYDETHYPPDLSPQEKAFMRFTALEDQTGVEC